MYTHHHRHTAFAAVAFVCIAVSALIGVLTYFFVRGQSANFFVAGRTLSLPVVAVTLASQSIDSNALLGNVHLSYKFHFYDGLVLPLGLALSLFLNAIFFARQLNRERVLTLPDVFAKRYGPVVEIFLSIASICSFLFLLAGNIGGMAQIMAYVTHDHMSPVSASWFGAGVVWVYTACGGLFSVAYTDVAQGVVGWTGALACAFWFITGSSPSAPPPSVGFPGYTYPNEDVCNAYNGVQCLFDKAMCCFNENAQGLAPDNGAYPTGDKSVFVNQMTDVLALSPFPNAMLWNWATIFILGFGNLAALDFQARCFASRSPRVATVGCVLAGVITLIVGVPFSYLGAITRYVIVLHSTAFRCVSHPQRFSFRFVRPISELSKTIRHTPTVGRHNNGWLSIIHIGRDFLSLSSLYAISKCNAIFKGSHFEFQYQHDMS